MTTNHHAHTGHQNSKGHGQTNPDPVLRPPANDQPATSQSAAIDLIRQKLASIYGDEPDAKQEMAEAIQPGQPHSKHQRFMLQLHQSGKPMAQIQAEWHQYYQSLDDAGKREVWQEFYSHSAQAKQQAAASVVLSPSIQPAYDANPYAHQPAATAAPVAMQPAAPSANPLYGNLPQSTGPRTGPMPDTNRATGQPVTGPFVSVHQEPATLNSQHQPPAIRQAVRRKVSSRGKLQAKHHLQSLLFGLGVGGLTLLVVLFSFFNEIIIAPFIQPSRQVSATPIIVSPDGVTPSDKDEVIIPKINVQIPLDFSSTSTDEKQFEAALDKGVAHYPTTALPGQKGNASFFGHSSNNIFNPGQYKFAFLMLNELVAGDTFYITYNETVYAYTVYDKRIVAATAVDILNPVPGKTATAMLVTCDPPGTSLRRLAVWGEQVSPNPNANSVATAAPSGTDKSSEALPGNGPTLWGRFQQWVTGQ